MSVENGLIATSSTSTNASAPDHGSQASAIGIAIAERLRQREQEGWSPEHDDGHSRGELARAAACYALQAAQRADVTPYSDMAGRKRWRIINWAIKRFWPWGWGWWKPRDARRDLIRAAALIIAEIERLDRADAKPRETCPDCGRPMAKCAHDAAVGMCPKWWAINDAAAERDCEASKL